MTRVEPLSSSTTTLATAPPTDAVGPSIAGPLTSVIPHQEPLRPTAGPLNPQRESSAIADMIDATNGQDGSVVVLGTVGYTLAWLGIYTLHIVCAVYLVSAGLMYAALPATQVANMLILYQLTLDPSYFVSIAYVHYAVAAAHCYLVAKPFCWAVGSRIVPKSVRLHLGALRGSVSQRLSTFSIGSSSQRTGSALVLKSAHSTTSGLLRRVYRLLLASDGLFGVHNQHFELIFLLRELVETALQSYQGYNMSRLLPHMRLNRFYTCMLIVNCFTTPVLRKVFHKNRSLQRLWVVLCDIVLDFASSIGVPVIVAMAYLAQYDPELTDFAPWSIWYDDLWLLSFMNEAPLVLFGSWLDAMSRLVFSIGLLSAMGDVKSLITRREVATITPSSSAQSAHDPRNPSTSTPEASSLLGKPERHATISKWVHRLLILWGLSIAGVFLEAQLRSSAQYCGLQLRPWLVQKPACGIVKIDCKLHPQISGTAHQVDEILDAIDAGSVEHVLFRHCAKVEIPLQFRNFHNLYGFKTYNSTIVSWAPEAEFTTQNHPRVRFAFFIMTQFPNGELPSSLIHPEFPQTLGDIEICDSNLRFLPDTLPWPLSGTLYIELSQLQVFPMVIRRLKPYTLSLAYNHIKEFPTEAIMAPDIAIVNLRGNPIVELPESGVDIHDLQRSSSGVDLLRITLQRTNISRLPLWISDDFLAQVNVRMGESPICTNVLLQVDSLERQTLLQERPYLSQINCRKSSIRTNYPMQLDAAEDA